MMVQGNRRGSLVGPLLIRLGRRLVSEGLAAASAQHIERLRQRVNALGLSQVSKALAGGRFRSELFPSAMLSPPRLNVDRQPEELLVGGAANLLDLFPSQK